MRTKSAPGCQYPVTRHFVTALSETKGFAAFTRTALLAARLWITASNKVWFCGDPLFQHPVTPQGHLYLKAPQIGRKCVHEPLCLSLE